MFVRSSHAIALFPGGFGTMDEGFEVLTLIQTGKASPMPLVFIDQPGGDYWRQWQDYVEQQLLERRLIGPDDLALYKITDDVNEAIHECRHFYSNYHSLRYTRNLLVMRLHRKPTAEQVKQINSEFADICAEGEFRASGPLKVERNEAGPEGPAPPDLRLQPPRPRPASAVDRPPERFAGVKSQKISQRRARRRGRSRGTDHFRAATQTPA